jgi:FkbM family methyltransferase
MGLMANLDRWRSRLKRLLNRTPFYGLGKNVWERIKVRNDRQRFTAAYPKADYKVYSKAELKRLSAEGYSSQYGQDHYLWTRFLSKRGGGGFVDIGANEPVSNSNSLFLEQQGWRGYAFDPMRSLAAQWAKARKTPIVTAGVSSTDEERMFTEVLNRTGWENQLSAFEGFVRAEDLAIYETTSYPVRCAPLYNLIDKDFRPDLAMIDVEGAELLVLDGLGFDIHRPEFILCENFHVIGGDPAVRKRIEREGYTLLARIGVSDDLFRRTDAQDSAIA